MPPTTCPASTSRGISRRPMTPDAPARNTRWLVVDGMCLPAFVSWTTLEVHLSTKAEEREEYGHGAVPADGRHDPDDIGELPGEHDGHAETEVGDDIDARDDSRTLVRGHERDDETQRRRERRAESEAGDGLSGEHRRQAAGGGAEEDPDRSDDGCVDADGHRGARAHPGERQPDDDRHRRRDEPGESVEQAAVAVEHAVDHA